MAALNFALSFLRNDTLGGKLLKIMARITCTSLKTK